MENEENKQKSESAENQENAESTSTKKEEENKQKSEPAENPESAESKSTKEADTMPTEYNGEPTMTLDEILKYDVMQEQEAEALLGGQDDMVCTYPEGYKYRQPLYSCLTCSAETGQKAGVCYACSINCHDGHDLVELYTKRLFCCDCGNSKFKNKCKLFEEKTEVNNRNLYNHNFDRLYCVCNLPFPPEEETEVAHEEMCQCCVCEDWYHFSHVFTEPEEKEMAKMLEEHTLEAASDFVCKVCMTKFPFLMAYKNISIMAGFDNVRNDQSSVADSDLNTTAESEVKDPNGSAVTESTIQSNVSASSSSSTECKIGGFKQDGVKPHALCFASTAWREQLCRCSKCLYTYDDLNCAFLLDPEDTMVYYDKKRLENMELKGETPINAPTDGQSKVAKEVYDLIAKKTKNHDAALHAYLAVEDMSKHIGEFFSTVGRDKVITPEDVKKCFEEISAKRRRLDPSTISSDADRAWTE